MNTLRNKFDDLTVGELKLLSDLPHFNSLRAFARSRQTQLSQLSRLIKKLENSFGMSIIERSPAGIGLTSFGKRICASANDVLLEFRKFSDIGTMGAVRSEFKLFSLASQGFLNFTLSPHVVKAALIADPTFAFRFLDLTDDEMILAANCGVLDFVLTIGELDLGINWVSHRVTELTTNITYSPASSTVVDS